VRNLETLAEKAKFTRRGPVPPTFDVNRVYSDAVLQGWRFWTRGWSLLRALVLGIAWWFCLRLLGFPMRAKLVYARWARQEMVRQGAVFIKLGQMLSTRVDAFSPEVVDELSRLQDQVPGFDFRVVQAVIEADLGAPLRQLFAKVDPVPLAAASLGQVHAATLNDGADVVVKVLRPGLAERFAIDLTWMLFMAERVSRWRWLLRLFGASPQTPYVRLVERLGISLYQQLDLWQEGLHGERFARNFASVPQVGAPAIYWSHTSTRILTQERIYGYRFDDEQGIRNAGIDYIAMAETGIRAFTKQIFEDAFFHADTHPGNVFVTADSRLIYLDFGMVEVIDEEFQAVLVEMFIHVIQQDWSAFLDDMVRADIVPAEVSRERLLPIFTEVWAAQLGFSSKRYTLQDVSDRFYAIMQEHPFRLPERFLFLTRTAASMEGVVYRANPHFKFLPVALPFFAKLVLSRVDVENPWLIREMLRSSHQGQSLERMLNLVRMAIDDDPAQMQQLTEQLVDVLTHPKAVPVRDALFQRALTGDMDTLVSQMPEGVVLSDGAWKKLACFLGSDAGKAWILNVLEHPQSHTVVGTWLQVARPGTLHVAWTEEILAHWFDDHVFTRRLLLALHRTLPHVKLPLTKLIETVDWTSLLTQRLPGVSWSLMKTAFGYLLDPQWSMRLGRDLIVRSRSKQS
jgi:predicted unusual protein kinase regulating ubiquinone biosynthesis (AarF/ABC1/UbiB family)